MKTVEYTKQENTMPAEVATELIRTPGTRLSARMRKECWAARSKVVSSPSPIRCASIGGYETDEKQVRRDFSEKCKRKFETLGAAKIIQLFSATYKRRLEVQRPFVKFEGELAKMQADNEPSHVVANAARYQIITQILQRLADEANRLDTIMDALDEEIQKRRLNVKTVPAIYHGRHFKKLRAIKDR